MKKPKVVYWDLETMPIPQEVYKRIPSFGAWPGRGFSSDIQSIICFGYKIEGDTEARCLNAWDFGTWEHDRFDDFELIRAAYDILCDADEIVTHNGKSFDVKMLDGRLAKHGLPGLPKIHHVDTKLVVKKLKLYSKRLNDVANFLGCENKMENGGWDLWTRIAFNNETGKDLRLMTEYCKQDVEVLQQVYLKTRSHHGISSVNKNSYVDPETMACPTCGSTHLVSNGWRISGGNAFKRMQCGDCGSWSRLNKKENRVSGL